MCIERRRASGFTLIELIIFIVVVSVGLAGVLSVLNVTVMHSADPVRPKQSLAIAEALMEEIQLKDFTPPATGDFAPSAPPLVTERQNFDNVFDFNNYGASSLSPTVLRAGIFDISGTAIVSLSTYKVLVTIANPASAPTGIAAAGDVWVITIQVTDPGGTVSTFTGYRINYG
jgi:MSHA pilin protein MshD